MKAEKVIEEALERAKGQGIRIIRGGAVFDWRDTHDPFKQAPIPSACDAIGAVLLAIGKQDLVRDGFAPDWHKTLHRHLDVDSFWLWRFVNGFAYGNCLSFTYTKDGKDYETKDDVSRLGDRLARKYAG